MILSDWLLITTSVMALVALYLARKKPRRYGGHTVGRIKFEDHSPRFTKDGKPLPSPSEVRQKRIESLRRFFLWAIAVIGIVIFIFRKLGW